MTNPFAKKKEEEKKEPETKAVVTVAKGSITATTPKVGGTALAIARAKMLLVCDRSGSMATSDAMHGKARYVVEDEIVSDLQEQHPGLIILEAFADSAILCLDGILPYPNGASTMIANALEFAAKTARRDMRVVLLTDGEASDPDEREVLKSAEALRGRLEIVYVGPDISRGPQLLSKMAKVAEGSYTKNKLDNPKALMASLEQFLLTSGRK